MANQIANKLLSEGVQPNQVVGVLVNRSIEMLASMIGVLKAGAAYLPLDPLFPIERIKFIVSDSNVGIIIVQNRFSEKEIDNCKLINIENIDTDSYSDEPNIQNCDCDDFAAYMIYTSGSTSNPKGVIVTNSNLKNFIYSMIHEPGISSDDRILAITTISFDIHILELIVPLATGATIVLVPQELQSNGAALSSLISNKKITVMQATPTTWKLICASGWNGGGDNFTLLCGGEPMSLELSQTLLTKCKSLYNMYGPTETTVWSTLYKVKGDENVIPIGKPIANTTVKILDKWRNEAPIGVWVIWLSVVQE